MTDIDARRVSAWILEVQKEINDEEVVSYLMKNAMLGDLKGDLSERIRDLFPRHIEALNKKNLLFL
jgi:hypothetical protein